MDNTPTDQLTTRREFNRAVTGHLTGLAFLSLIGTHRNIFSAAKVNGDQFFKKAHEAARQLYLKKISQVQWQSTMEEVMALVDPQALQSWLNYDYIRKYFLASGNKFSRIPIGKPRKWYKTYGTQWFCMRKGGAVVPHGHNYMSSLFYIMSGQVRGRHYNRIKDDGQHVIIEPSIDKSFGPHTFSTMSDDQNNVHWLKGEAEYSLVLNIHLIGVATGPRKTGRFYVDPTQKMSSVGGGQIAAPIISKKAAYSKFLYQAS